MRIRVPSKKVRERFLLIYELEGCQKAVDYLTKYYGVRRMRIVVNGRRVGKGDFACYEENKAYFSKKGLTKRTILHELFHHFVFAYGLDMSETKEDREANRYAKNF
jgi:hypothetical protein